MKNILKNKIYQVFKDEIIYNEKTSVKINTIFYGLQGIQFLKAWDKAPQKEKSKVVRNFYCACFIPMEQVQTTVDRYLREFISKEKKKYLWSF